MRQHILRTFLVTNMIKFKHSKKAGFSLIESLIYIAIIAIMTALIVNILLSTVKSYNSLKISRNINNSAITSLERIIREIKASDDIDVVNSVFDVNPGKLTVKNATTTSEFYLDGSVLKIKENGIDAGALTHNEVFVDNIVFSMADNGTSKGIKIEMTLSSSHQNLSKTKKFYSFGVLRNSY